MKYIIDTDPGFDDAMAIMLALKSDLYIAAITTTIGNSTIENTTRNAQYILELLNEENTPVYSGSKKPLKKDLIQAVVHGQDGLGGMTPKNKPKLSKNAVDKILSIIEKEDKVTLVTLGPLTNIAKAIKRNKKTMLKLDKVIIMGGAIKEPGNKNRVAEFNMFVDPEAADIVFKLPVQKTMVPLDVCNKTKLFLKDFKKIKGKLKKPLLKMAKPYIKNINKDEGIKGAIMYDPLTIYYLLNPNACTIKSFDVLIETKGKLTRGMTVADLRKKSDNNNLINVVWDISVKDFKKDFIKYLSG